MARRNIRKQMMGGAMALTTTGIIMGTGAQAVTAAGGNAAGVGAFSSYMPIKMKCHRCGYQWRTSSKMKYVTCPSCLTKVKR